MKIKPIITGAKNSIIKDKDIEQLAHQRLSICRQCNLYTEKSVVGERCDKNKFVYVESKDDVVYGCGCKLSWKTRQNESKCPLGKW